jgi:sugar/nucleoside kinase (ribokinase family)
LPEILVAGHICVDLFPQFSGGPEVLPGRLLEVGPLRIEAGGCVANTGIALARLGAHVRIAADAGDDELGRILQRMVANSGMSADLHLLPGRTTSYSVVIQPPRDNRAFWHHTGANDQFDGSGLRLEGASILHVGYPSLLPALQRDGGAALTRLFTEARAAGALTSMDLATVDPASPAGAVDWGSWLHRVLAVTDIFTPSIDDLALALGEQLEARPAALRHLSDSLIEQGVAIILVKLGDHGLYLRTAPEPRFEGWGLVQAAAWARQELWAAALEVEIANTTGAGDSAAAGLLFGMLEGLDPRDALLAAAAAAATRIERGEVGAWPELRPRLRSGWRSKQVDLPGWEQLANGLHRAPLLPAQDAGVQ